jgi:hypothetical protein
MVAAHITARAMPEVQIGFMVEKCLGQTAFSMRVNWLLTIPLSASGGCRRHWCRTLVLVYQTRLDGPLSEIRDRNALLFRHVESA